MGIERFFNSMRRNETVMLQDGITMGLKEQLPCNYLYIDFNSIVYNVATDIDEELAYLLYDIIINSGPSSNLDEKAMSIAKKWEYKISSHSVDSYVSYFTEKVVDTELIRRVGDYIVNIVKNILYPDQIKSIFIGVDGIPTMSKIVEQRRRRYSGYIISELKKMIRDKFGSSLSPQRELYEKYVSSYDRGRITTWTELMHRISEFLGKDPFVKTIRNICPELTSFTISSQNVPGEGEKKIMEHVIKYAQSGRYILFSPDADVIILGMILYNKLAIKNIDINFDILRFNQQSREYDLVSIDTLRTNMYDYIKQKTNRDIDIIDATNDIAFLFTLFGNDFVPKIEAINVRNDFETILNAYCKNINRTPTNDRCILIFKDEARGTYKIAFYHLFNIMKILSYYEDDLMHDSYIANNYKNYNFLKTIFTEGRLYNSLKEYIYKANKLIDLLRERMIMKDNDLSDIIKSYSSDTKFMRHFSLIEGRMKDISGDIGTVFAGVLRDLYNKHEIRGSLKLQYFETTIESAYHIKNIKEHIAHPLMEITEYDKQIYKLDRHMDEYAAQLNAENYTLGEVKLRFDSKKKYSIWVDSYKHVEKGDSRKRYIKDEYCPSTEDKNQGKLRSSIVAYYIDFFNIDLKSDKGVNDLKVLVNEYIRGLFWVFDFYFNKNDFDTNYNHVATWYYDYIKAPLLNNITCIMESMIKKGMDNFVKEMNRMFTEVSDVNNIRMYVDRSKFMNKLEHYIYITPYERLKKQTDIPISYVKEIDNEKNKDIFPLLKEIVKAIMEFRGHEYINCRGVNFLNKCHLMTVRDVGRSEFMRRMIPARYGVEKTGKHIIDRGLDPRRSVMNLIR